MRAAAGRGLFITLEGIDGCGKSTQAALLGAWLEECAGLRVLRTFEPGGWGGGALLRNLLLGGTSLGDRTELLLFLADRSGHLDAEILPALGRGEWVLCERYTDSTFAYQSWGRGIPLDTLDGLVNWCRFLSPDLTILLDVDVETARARLASRGALDRIEKSVEESGEGFVDSGISGFMTRVARGYKELAKRFPERILVVDADQEVERVAESVRQSLKARLKGRFPEAGEGRK